MEADTLLLITNNDKEKLQPGNYKTYTKKGTELEFYINENGNADQELKSVYNGMIIRHYYLENGRINAFMEREPDYLDNVDSTFFQQTEIPLYDSLSGKWKFESKLCKVTQSFFKDVLRYKRISYKNNQVKWEEYENGKLSEEKWTEFVDTKKYENGKLALQTKYNWETKEYENIEFDNAGKMISQVREYEHGMIHNFDGTVTIGGLDEESRKKSYKIYTEFHPNGKPKIEKRTQAGIVTIKHFSNTGKLLKTEKEEEEILPSISAPPLMN